MADIEIDIKGLEELKADLEKVVKKYPNEATTTMERAGKKFKSDCIKEANSAVEKHTGKLTKGFSVDRVKTGYAGSLEVDFHAEGRGNPHFHLIENGHSKVTQRTRHKKPVKGGGRTIGFVPGRLIVHAVREQYANGIMAKFLEDCIEKVLKESDL